MSEYTSFPDLSDITYVEISRGTGISVSMLSRMFSDDPKQKRPNPSLRTMLKLQNYLSERTGQAVSLDDLARAID